jgi:AAA+ superfamily predicted ATPase
MSSSEAEWHERNQTVVSAWVEVVRAAFRRRARRGAGEDPDPSAESRARASARAAEQAIPRPSSRATLCSVFGLSDFERDVLMSCAAMELTGDFGAECAAAHGDAHRPFPTFGLALAALPGAHWSALAPLGPLRRWRMLDVGAGEGVAAAPLRIDERILHYLAGIGGLDERLTGIVAPVLAVETLPGSFDRPVSRIADLWSGPKRETPPPVVEILSGDLSTARTVVTHASEVARVALFHARASDIPAAAAERDACTILWEREAALGGAALVVTVQDDDPPDVVRTATAFVDRLVSPVAVVVAQPTSVASRPVVRVSLDPPTAREQREWWFSALGPLAEELDGGVDRVASQFRLATQSVRAAGAEVAGLASSMAPGDERRSVLADALWDACRTHARQRIDDLAERIEPMATWDDLVVTERQRRVLRQVAVHVRHRALVYEQWGFAGKSARGLGVSALFSGPSGTGKTMAAEVLANDLRLDLYRIDLSPVVSKYIGETEKNLKRVFDAAEGGGAILLFDEADALFGKRSEIKDSHDRYANIEVSYLLQRMEAYRGLAILTTNIKSALDHAFMRRIRFVVHFLFPETAQRREIWRGVFPASAPLEALDWDVLARLSVAGGNIRNIAMNAAFLAADDDSPVTMGHILAAARGEYAKLERSLTEAETRGWS